MDGLAKALEYAVNLAEPHYTEHEGEKWSDKEMYRIHQELPKAEPIKMNTLSSLIDYIKSDTDVMAKNMIIHIQSPTRVVLLSDLDNDRMRETLVEVDALLPEFVFGKFYQTEEFVINVMAKFIGDQPSLQGDDEKSNVKENCKEIILKFAGTVETGTIASYGDDGVSQKATIQKSCTSKEDVLVPNPVFLIPYRTFLEVQQPGSDFIFRMRESDFSGAAPEAALFEADGGAWKIDAKRHIHEYLSENLKDITTSQGTVFTIIS